MKREKMSILIWTDETGTVKRYGPTAARRESSMLHDYARDYWPFGATHRLVVPLVSDSPMRVSRAAIKKAIAADSAPPATLTAAQIDEDARCPIAAERARHTRLDD